MASVVALSRSGHGVCGSIIKVGSWRLWWYYEGQVMVSGVILRQVLGGYEPLSTGVVDVPQAPWNTPDYHITRQ